MVEGAEKQGLPEINIPKVSRWLLENEHNPRVFIGVNKSVTALFVLIKAPDTFSYTEIIRDLVFYSNTPGAGFRLLKEGEQWIHKWGKSVHKAYLTTSQNTEEVDIMLEKYGMNKIGSQFEFKLGDS